jgi:dihydrodipicolinate synthase/N-acetylneuraminate lyase
LAQDGSIDWASLARLLAHFEAEGCAGVVLAGTNGEGPSLSAVEKRGLIREAQAMKGRLEIILGLATCSLAEAQWLAGQASKAGADGLLLMPPFFFRNAPEEGIEAWMRAVMDASSCPVLAYENPGASGISFSIESLARLAKHPMCGGLKDSSGRTDRMEELRSLFGGALFVGNEVILPEARAAGWNGAISGAANAIPRWIVEAWTDPVKHEMALPAIRALKACPQPAVNKALLARMGVIESPAPRPPLTAEPEAAEQVRLAVEADLGPVFEPW